MMLTSSFDSCEHIVKINEFLWVFPCKRTSNRVTSWWLDSDPEPILVDCPQARPGLFDDLQKLSAGRKTRILLTSKDGHGEISKLSAQLGWPVLVQEQESYLLPGLSRLESFSEEFVTSAGLKLLWTPGPSPGSCVICAPHPWNVLFCGRLLIRVASGQIAPIRNSRTFHWPFYKKSLKKLLDWIPSKPFPKVASGLPFYQSATDFLMPWDAWKYSQLKDEFD